MIWLALSLIYTPVNPVMTWIDGMGMCYARQATIDNCPWDVRRCCDVLIERPRPPNYTTWKNAKELHR